MLHRLSLAKSDAVLDLGCAFGVWTNHVQRRVRRAVGVDLDAQALDLGRRLYPGIDLREADATRLPFCDGEFDKLLFISTLEHIENQEAALDEVARVLKPGGLLAISVDTLDHPAWVRMREPHARRSHVTRYLGRDKLMEMAIERRLDARWTRYMYGNHLAPRLLAPRLKPSNLHWLLAPAVRLSGAVLDEEDSGMILQAVFERA